MTTPLARLKRAGALAVTAALGGGCRPPAAPADASHRQTRAPTEPAPATAPAPERRAGDPPLPTVTGGVRFSVPAGWTVTTEGGLAIAQSPTRDAGLLLYAYDELALAPTALRRAEREFGLDVPVGLGRQQLRLGALPYGFILQQQARERGQALERVSVLMGRGVATRYLVVLVYVRVPRATASAEEQRLGELFEEIFSSFTPVTRL